MPEDLEITLHFHPGRDASGVVLIERLPILRPHVLPKTTFCFPDSVEAQVSGRIDIARDVAAVVLDPSYRGTEVERFARGLLCPVRRHDGFVLSLDRVHVNAGYRTSGRSTWPASSRSTVCYRGGARARGRLTRPADPQYVWHHIARFGHAVDEPGGGPAIVRV